MKKTFAILGFIMMVLILAAGPFSGAARAISQEAAANALNQLGLMDGVGTNSDGSVNFDLQGTANRQTAATMLVRVLGRGADAASGSWRLPFSDYDAWAKPYVGYAYQNGLVNGVSASSFGGTGTVTAQQYITMILRALGYSDKESDGNADFSYSSSCAFSQSIGLNDGSYTNSTKTFRRGDIAVISFTALGLSPKGTKTTLYAQTTGKPASDLAAAEKAAAAADPPNVSRSRDGNVAIDYGGSAGGIVKVSAKVPGNAKLCVIVTSPKGNQYKYFYTDATGVSQDFVLSEGNGTYQVGVYKNVSGTTYTTLHATSFSVKLSSDLSPFLRANYYVEYSSSTKAIKAAGTICKSCATELEKVEAVYYYVINNFTYDYEKAAAVQSGYRPDIDAFWDSKKGICFDYASAMTAMLRSQGVASKLVIGYAGTVYHAWLNVYTKETGWIEAVIYFDGANWKLMDPTFASTGNSSEAIMKFINDPSNYSAKYAY